jgi:hypothetical protein
MSIRLSGRWKISGNCVRRTFVVRCT